VKTGHALQGEEDFAGVGGHGLVAAGDELDLGHDVV